MELEEKDYDKKVLWKISEKEYRITAWGSQRSLRQAMKIVAASEANPPQNINKCDAMRIKVSEVNNIKNDVLSILVAVVFKTETALLKISL